MLSVSLARRITSGPACLASVIASTHSTVFFSGPINREMRNLISSLKNHNEQLKGEISRYKRKLREASIELSKVCIQNCAKLSHIYLYSVLHCLNFLLVITRTYFIIAIRIQLQHILYCFKFMCSLKHPAFIHIGHDYSFSPSTIN